MRVFASVNMLEDVLRIFLRHSKAESPERLVSRERTGGGEDGKWQSADGKEQRFRFHGWLLFGDAKTAQKRHYLG
jgi:hypothetical protein